MCKYLEVKKILAVSTVWCDAAVKQERGGSNSYCRCEREDVSLSHTRVVSRTF